MPIYILVHLSSIFTNLFNFTFTWKTEREMRFSNTASFSQTTAKAGARAGRSRNHEHHPGFPQEWQEPKNLNAHLSPSWAQISRKQNARAVAGDEPRTLIWNAEDPSTDSPHSSIPTELAVIHLLSILYWSSKLNTNPLWIYILQVFSRSLYPCLYFMGPSGKQTSLNFLQ